MKKQKNLKIEEDTLDTLRKLAKDKNKSQGEIVEEAIQKLAESYTLASHDNTSESDPLRFFFLDQIKVKDEQIAHLQKSLDQEQQLHAATKQELKLLGEKKHWWNKFW